MTGKKAHVSDEMSTRRSEQAPRPRVPYKTTGSALRVVRGKLERDGPGGIRKLGEVGGNKMRISDAMSRSKRAPKP